MDIDKDRYECKLRASEMRFLINVKKQPWKRTINQKIKEV
jgi:hypothetical protein